MEDVGVGKRASNKIKTKNAILRYKNGSFQVINREALNKKFVARIRRERQNILDKRRDLAKIELRKIAADVLEDEWSSQKPILPDRTSRIDLSQNGFNLDQELLLEEQLDQESFQHYEDWLEQEIDSLLASEDTSDDYPVICPVCCRQSFRCTTNSIECEQCQIAYPLSKSIAVLRNDINMNLVEHNANCYYHPQFTTVPDSGGRNTLLILCHACCTDLCGSSCMEKSSDSSNVISHNASNLSLHQFHDPS